MWGSSRTMFCQNIVKIGLLTLLRKQRHWRPAANGMGSSRAAGGGLGRTEAAAACLPLYSAGASSPHLFDFFHCVLLFMCFLKAIGPVHVLSHWLHFSARRLGSVPACLFAQLELVPAGLTLKDLPRRYFNSYLLFLVEAKKAPARTKSSILLHIDHHGPS